MIKKKYGQNFLTSNFLAKKITKILNIKSQNVLEIGPGNLALTKYILESEPKKFIAIDIDEDIIKKHRMENKKFNKYLLHENALKFDELNFFNKKSFIIISNLPFNISSKLLIKWVKIQYKLNCINGMVLMFQKELGERIISKENKKKYGRLSVLTQLVFKVEKIMIVKKENFFPMPKVDAIVIKFTPIIEYKNIKFDKLEKLTSFFFGSRRKKNEKKIKKLFTIDQIKKNNLDKIYDQRPENIPKEIFYKMSSLL